MHWDKNGANELPRSHSRKKRHLVVLDGSSTLHVVVVGYALARIVQHRELKDTETIQHYSDVSHPFELHDGPSDANLTARLNSKGPKVCKLDRL